MKIIVSRADEVGQIMKKKKVAAVLSIEHPGVRPQQKGYAPRITGVPQKILCFWDSEQVVHQGPDILQVEQGLAFIMENIAKGDVIIHCQAGKARSTAMALGALSILYPNEDEKSLIDRLLKIRPQSAPNIIVVEMVDKLTGRNGKLLQAVKDHPILEAQRISAEKGRQEWLARDPEAYRRMNPEKFPKP
jgi:predicted protein tyrosine phosphatase